MLFELGIVDKRLMHKFERESAQLGVSSTGTLTLPLTYYNTG
ncbi:hypothetical protein OAN61_00200 [bacterium]|nr:hypothetical protein [bacterium]